MLILNRKAPQGSAGEVGDEGAEEKQGKKKEHSQRQNCWFKLFRRFPGIFAQMPCVVDAKATRGERHCNDEKNPVNVSHVVHDGPLQVADVVDAFVAQPAFMTEYLVLMDLMDYLYFLIE